MSDSLQPRGLEATRLLCPWDSPGKNTGVGCQALLQGIFPIQGSNPGLLHCRQILYHLNHREATMEVISLYCRLYQLFASHTSELFWSQKSSNTLMAFLSVSLCAFFSHQHVPVHQGLSCPSGLASHYGNCVHLASDGCIPPPNL